MMKLNKIICGDAWEELRKLPDESINLIFTDLPYGETGNEWDKDFSKEKLTLVLIQFDRIIKPEGAIVLNATFRFGMKLIEILPHLYKYDLIWQKDNATNIVAANHQPLRIHEHLLVFGKQAVTYTPRGKYMKYNPQKTVGKAYRQISGKQSKNWKGGKVEGFETINNGDRHPISIQFWQRDKEKLHPTQKPLAMAKWIINSYSNKGDIVLDATCGSGTTAVAAKMLNRNYIGIEKNPEYCQIAEERLICRGR